jgi:hypothetical protein
VDEVLATQLLSREPVVTFAIFPEGEHEMKLGGPGTGTGAGT